MTWRSLETLPEDGSYVFVAVQWTKGKQRGVVGEAFYSGGKWWWGSGPDHAIELNNLPYAWMPIPNAPPLPEKKRAERETGIKK